MLQAVFPNSTPFSERKKLAHQLYTDYIIVTTNNVMKSLYKNMRFNLSSPCDVGMGVYRKLYKDGACCLLHSLPRISSSAEYLVSLFN